jgi:integrase
MPRSYRLTWQPGSKGRTGRWRKKYKGKVYYFDGGRGKSDRAAYEVALTEWEAIKVKIDADAPRPHQLDYERTIAEWEQVLAWSNRHDERDMAAVAFEKLERLRHLLEAPVLKPLKRSDRFESLFDAPLPVLPDDLMQTAAAALAGESVVLAHSLEVDRNSLTRFAEELDGSSLRINREMWRDRLETQQRRATIGDDSVRAQADEYLREKQLQVDAGELTVGRLYAIDLHLKHFRDWLGGDTAVTDIDGKMLMKYRSHLLEKMEAKDWTRTTVRHYLVTIKGFIRWLWRMEMIPALPRILDGKTDFLRVGAATPEIVVYTVEELHALLQAASDRTKLYILLMLNCGMTQKDESDLEVSQVDWEEGRIIRKRSKTSSHEKVPTVNYLLWPDTFRLLVQERNQASSGRVLVNANGSPLCTQTMEPDSKFKRTDNVKNAFDRLKNKVDIKKPLKSLKKTSATLLRGNERFQGLEGLFLGHAPQTMSDKHYTQVPGKLLDQAIAWLERHYQIRSLFDSNSPT